MTVRETDLILKTCAFISYIEGKVDEKIKAKWKNIEYLTKTRSYSSYFFDATIEFYTLIFIVLLEDSSFIIRAAAGRLLRNRCEILRVYERNAESSD